MNRTPRLQKLLLAATLAAGLASATPATVRADGGAVAAVIGATFAGLIIGSAAEHQAHAAHRPVYAAYPVALHPVPVHMAPAHTAPVTLARVAPVTVSYTVPTVLYAAPVVHAAPVYVTYIPVVAK